MSDEHQRRWVAEKNPVGADLARVADARAKLRASVDAGLQMLAEIARRLGAAESFADYYDAVDRFAELSRALARYAHSAKAFCDWNIAPVPDFTDHLINQFFIWPEHKRTFWLEGAMFCALAMKRGGRYLELCCGSGFYSDMFYAAVAKEIVAVDLDPRAIEMARRQHARPNVRYEVADIRAGLPEGPFDGVIWDGAIEHFSSTEIETVMTEITRKLVPGGLLSGYTIAEAGDGVQHPDHEQEFKDMRDLGDRLKRYFKNVLVFESLHATVMPARHNLFFFAGDGVLPFDANWPRCYRPSSREE